MKKKALTILFLALAYPLLGQTDNPILKVALTYLDTPYVAHTLERTRNEQLVFNKKEVDCTTFVENVLAETLAAVDTTECLSAKEYLQQIRYRDGIIEDYTSRLHYISEWAIEGEKNGFITDLTNKYGTDSMYIVLSYMSEHPQYYRHLAKSKANQQKIREIEKNISGTNTGWVPKADLPDQGLNWIHNGDIIALTVGIRGLDVSHIGFAIYVNDELHLLHASSTKGKVIIEPIPLSQMLHQNKNWNGIRVFRPQVYPEREASQSMLDIIEERFPKFNFENL